MSYAELHCKTNFSFLEGASHPDELVNTATELGYAALAITDRGSLAGVVRAHVAARETGLKLLIGAEIHPVDAPPAVLLATDRAAYGRLARLITCGRRKAEKGECRLTFDDVATHAEGLLAAILSRKSEVGSRKEEGKEENTDSKNNLRLASSEIEDRVLPGHTGRASGTQQESIPISDFRPSTSDLSSEFRIPNSELECYREVFGDRCSLLAELHLGADDERRLAQLVELSKQTGIPLAAAGDVHYHVPDRRPLHDVLTAVRAGCTVTEARDRLFANGERHLKPLSAITRQFACVPAAIRRTVEIAEQCTFSLAELRYEYPEELAPLGETPLEYLGRLTWEGARGRYPQGIPEKVRGLIQYELKLVEELHYEAYFLTVWDLVRFARSRSILCQGRGSAANSVICYCLGVTAVDPERMDVLFERFISRERAEAPDIDVDFEHERREEVLQYLYEKYGRERAGMTAEVITYRPRSAVRDVGKALGLSLDRVDALAKNLDGYTVEPRLAQRCRQAGFDTDSQVGHQLIALVGQLVGFPRHLSQHVGGMVMTQGPLCELVPIENAAMPGRTVIEWDKDDLDELGILKVDCLALGMLTAIRKCFDLVCRHHGRELTLASIPEGDQAVYDMICRADTMGVFQIESRAQMSMLPRLRPRQFYDLVIEVAIVRPGPIQGNMVHPYLRRRAGLEPVSYPNEATREVLQKTLGVPLFQEQAMRLAVVAAGFTPGEADQLRRAMGAWRRPGIIDDFGKKLIDGMLARGLSQEFAENVFEQIRGFGSYGFPESHAASFALLVYVSAWLKCHYPAAFGAAIVNSQPMGFYAPAQLVRNAQEHGVAVRPVDVNHSDWDCTLEAEEAPSSDSGATGCLSASAGHTGGQATSATQPQQHGQLETTSGVVCHGLCPCSQDTLAEPVAPKAGPLTSGALSLRLGLRMVLGLPEAQGEAIAQARSAGAFRSLHDFTRRTGASQAVVARLAAADAFGSLGLDRRRSLWEALAQEKQTCPQPLFAALDEEEPAIGLPTMSRQEEVFADYQTAGLSLKAHPISFFRDDLNVLDVLAADKLPHTPNHRWVRVAGLVLVRQRPGTAGGITFVTLEDETGTVNLIIRLKIWERYYHVARTASALLATGRLQAREKGVIHVLVNKLEDLSGKLRGMRSVSRDFQ